jgi:hypothetical protein
MYKRLVAMLVAAILAAVSLVGVVSSPANAQSVTSVVMNSTPDPNDPSAPIDPIVPPKIIGKMTVGSVIKIDIGKWDPPPFVFITNWFKILPDGTKVKLKSFVRNHQYRIKESDRGLKIIAEVRAIHSKYQTVIYTKPRLVR